MLAFYQGNQGWDDLQKKKCVVNFAFANLRRRNSVVMGTHVTGDIMIFGSRVT